MSRPEEAIDGSRSVKARPLTLRVACLLLLALTVAELIHFLLVAPSANALAYGVLQRDAPSLHDTTLSASRATGIATVVLVFDLLVFVLLPLICAIFGWLGRRWVRVAVALLALVHAVLAISRAHGHARTTVTAFGLAVLVVAAAAAVLVWLPLSRKFTSRSQAT